MSGFGKKRIVHAPPEKRKATRSSVEAGAIVMTTASRLSAVMIDISASGAGLSGCVPPQRGRDVEVLIGGHALFGQVVWRRDEAFGVKFEVPLTHDELAAIDAAIRQVTEQERIATCEIAILGSVNKASGE